MQNDRCHKRFVELSDVLKAIKKHSVIYYIVLPIAFIFAVVYAMAQPNFYVCRVELSPEIGYVSKDILYLAKNRKLADLVKINDMGIRNPLIYSEIMHSFDFQKDLLYTKVHRTGDKQELLYYDYLLNYQNAPWWSQIGGKKEIVKMDSLDPMKLSFAQGQLLTSVRARVKCNFDEYSLAITIQVIDQDPLVSAIIANEASCLLQKHITNHYVQKAQNELDYNKKMLEQRRIAYNESKDTYVKFADSHRELTTEVMRMKEKYLEEEMNQNFNALSERLNMKLQSEAKVQESKPSFTTLQSAKAPIESEGPDRVRMVVMFTTYFFYIITVYILYKERKTIFSR